MSFIRSAKVISDETDYSFSTFSSTSLGNQIVPSLIWSLRKTRPSGKTVHEGGTIKDHARLNSSVRVYLPISAVSLGLGQARTISVFYKLQPGSTSTMQMTFIKSKISSALFTN